MSRFSRTPEKTARARELRRAMTPSEGRLWLHLRGGAMGVSFRRQHPVGPYFADFCCPSLKIIIELDGGQHADRAAYDAARSAFLEQQGYLVARFWNNEVIEELDGVCEQIVWLIRRRQFEQRHISSDPLPASPFQGEE
ncbi:MAG: endonuclease domain-containing protein [Caulobacteraceae bacterium]